MLDKAGCGVKDEKRIKRKISSDFVWMATSVTSQSLQRLKKKKHFLMIAAG